MDSNPVSLVSLTKKVGTAYAVETSPGFPVCSMTWHQFDKKVKTPVWERIWEVRSLVTEQVRSERK